MAVTIDCIVLKFVSGFDWIYIIELRWFLKSNLKLSESFSTDAFSCAFLSFYFAEDWTMACESITYQVLSWLIKPIDHHSFTVSACINQLFIFSALGFFFYRIACLELNESGDNFLFDQKRLKVISNIVVDTWSITFALNSKNWNIDCTNIKNCVKNKDKIVLWNCKENIFFLLSFVFVEMDFEKILFGSKITFNCKQIRQIQEKKSNSFTFIFPDKESFDPFKFISHSI